MRGSIDPLLQNAYQVKTLQNAHDLHPGCSSYWLHDAKLEVLTGHMFAMVLSDLRVVNGEAF